MELASSPSRAVSVPVLLGGIATTVLVLVFRAWVTPLIQTDPLLFVGWYVLPIGSYLVGLLAGTGYAGVSWMRGVRLSRATMWAIGGVAALAFVASQVADYLLLLSYGGALPGFGAWFDEVTRAIAFTSDRGPDTGPIGVLGYGLMLLVMAGFVLGSLSIPAGLRARNYCAACGQYMRTKQIGALPASVPSRIMLGKSAETKAAYEAEQQVAHGQGMAVHDHLFALAQGADPAAFADAARLVEDGSKPAAKLPTRLLVGLSACPSCRAGVLASQTVTGQGRSQQMAKLAEVPVAPEMVRAFRG